MPRRDPMPHNEPEQLPLGGIAEELRLPEQEASHEEPAREARGEEAHAHRDAAPREQQTAQVELPETIRTVHAMEHDFRAAQSAEDAGAPWSETTLNTLAAELHRAAKHAMDRFRDEFIATRPKEKYYPSLAQAEGTEYDRLTKLWFATMDIVARRQAAAREAGREKRKT